jgi:hypothetical protein
VDVYPLVEYHGEDGAEEGGQVDQPHHQQFVLLDAVVVQVLALMEQLFRIHDRLFGRYR